MILKPFDLEAALAGAKVVTRDGRKASEIVVFRTADTQYPVSTVIHGTIYSHSIDGLYFGRANSDLDLFIAPKTHYGWLNIYRNDKTQSCGMLHMSREEADDNECENRVACIRIEWEE